MEFLILHLSSCVIVKVVMDQEALELALED